MSWWMVVIALLVGLAGCGGGDSPQPVAKRDACGSNVQKLDGPTTRLTYRGSDDVVEDVPVVCARLKAANVAHQVEGPGPERLVITVPDKAVVAAKSAARTGRLAFYDWEANVIGPGGKPAPADTKVTGGAAAGQVGSLERYDAVLRASKRPANAEANNARRGSLYFAVDEEAKKVFGQGAATRAAALQAVPAAERTQAKVLEVKAGTIVVRGEQHPDVDDPDGRWYFVLRDDVALRGSEIEQPEQNFDQGAGNGEPIVTFEFTPGGRKAFGRLTRTVAERGARSVGVSGQPAADANQHFAIVLDDQIVSIPYVDFRLNPGGIDGSTGSQIQGGFTIASARQLATILKTGELEVPLELVATERSG